MGILRRHKIGVRRSLAQKIVDISIAFIAMVQVQISYRGLYVTAFQQASPGKPNLRPATCADYVFDSINDVMLDPPSATNSNTILHMASGKKNTDDKEQEISPAFWEDIGKKPGNLIIIPFIAIFGIDLILNIIFIAKRTIEFFVFGQVASTEPWW